MGEISTITLLDGVTYDIKDAKSRMTILKYGSSTWADFITAYDNKAIVYCRASSNSNPGTGSQTRLAFMAYVNNETTPTEVEFQYYRSVSSHSDSQQGDQVYVYKLNKTNGWSVTTRNAFTKVIAGTGLTSSFTTGTSSSITLSFDTADASDVVYDNTASGLSSTSVQGAIDEVASDIDKSNAIFINFSATGHFLDEEYETTDGWWTFDSITDADGNSLTYTDLFSAFQDGKNIFLNATSAMPYSGGTNYYYYKNIPMSGVDAAAADPNTVYYTAFDFVDGTSDDQSTWRVWVVIYDRVDPVIYQINVDGSDADNIRYSNTASGLTATDVQDAIDEISTVAGLTDTNISSPTEGQILHYDETNSKWVNDKTASGSFSIFPTTSEDATIQVTGDASHQANVGVYNSLVSGTMHINMGTTGTKELVCYDANGNRSVAIAHDANGNYSGEVFNYDNTVSGLSATTTQAAIDELASEKADASDYLPLSAGSTKPLTGWLYTEKNGEVRNVLKSTTWDNTSSGGGVSTTEYSGFYIKDKNANNVGTFETYISNTGRVTSRLTARNQASGTESVNQLQLSVSALGARSVTVSDAEAWRTAIGVTIPSRINNGTTFSVTSNLPSDTSWHSLGDSITLASGLYIVIYYVAIPSQSVSKRFYIGIGESTTAVSGAINTARGITSTVGDTSLSITSFLSGGTYYFLAQQNTGSTISKSNITARYSVIKLT